MSRRLNVGRMRRHQERDRERYFWSREERRALLEQMRESVDRMRAEDGLPPLRIVERGEVAGGE